MTESGIVFLRPLLLLALLLVPLVLLWPRRIRDARLGILRCLVLALVVLALARPVTVGSGGALHHVLILDRSPSVADAAGAERAAKSILAGLPGSARTTLILAGGARAPRGLAADHVLTLPDAGSGSPLSLALQLAAASIPAGAGGAVTLLSDGLATDRRWGPALQDLCARRIPLNTVVLPGPRHALRPVGLSALQPLQVGRTARMAVTLAGRGEQAHVELAGPDGVLATLDGVRCDGRARLVLEFEPRRAGFLSVTARVRASGALAAPAGDLERTFAVQDPFRVLYLGERMVAGAERLAELVGPGFEIVAGGSQDPDSVPLTGYDMAMIDDRPAARLPRELQQALVDAVKNQGLGLLASGGSAAFGPGGYHKTPLESVLPVEFVQKEEKKDPSTSLAIIIDTSGSMGGNRIRLAKEVTRLAIRRLLPHDKVGIVEFYGNKRWAAPLQSAANAIDIQRALNRLDAGGGTILLPAIEEAYYGLRNVQTRYKHCMILTDAGVESGSYESLMRRMARDGICVSTVLVGPGRHSEFLVQLASWGNGRYYNASNRFNLPEIMLKQPSTARLPAYRPGPHALTGRGGPGWWGAVDPGSVPALDGYVETRPRPGAEVLLATTRDDHPVLASWRFGLGRVTAFMSEPTGAGTESWKDWPGYGPMLARVLARTAGDARRPFTFSLERRDHQLLLVARRRERSLVRPVARRLDAAGDEGEALSFRQVAPARFEARFEEDPTQAVRILAGVDDARRRVAFRLVSDPLGDVAPELLVDPDRGLDPGRAAAATGGRTLPVDQAGGFVPGASEASRPRSALALWPWCLLVALLAWLAEILYRRLPRRHAAQRGVS